MKKFKRILALALLAVSLCAVALPALAVNNIPVETFANIGPHWDVNMRADHNTTSSIVGYASYYHSLYIRDRWRGSDGVDWYYVFDYANETVGWVYGNYVYRQNPVSYSGLSVGSSTTVKSSNVNMRTGPSTAYSLASTPLAQTGDSVTVYNKNSSQDGYTWYRVFNSTRGIIAWIRGDFLNGA